MEKQFKEGDFVLITKTYTNWMTDYTGMILEVSAVNHNANLVFNACFPFGLNYKDIVLANETMVLLFGDD